MTKFKIGDRVLVLRHYECPCTTSTRIVKVDKSDQPFDQDRIYGVYIDREILWFRTEWLVPISKDASRDQVRALKRILG